MTNLLGDLGTLSNAGSAIRVIVGGEHRIFSGGFERLFDKTFEVISGSFGEPFLDEVRQRQPHIIIKGLSTDVSKGLDTISKVGNIAPNSRIIVVTMWDNPTIITETFRRGASAYLLQTSEPSEFLTAVRTVLDGHTYMTRSLTAAAIDALRLRHIAVPRHGLTARQRSIVTGLAQGKAMKEIAADLQISARTVAFHKYRIMERLNLNSSADLLRYAIRNNIG